MRIGFCPPQFDALRAGPEAVTRFAREALRITVEILDGAH
jgi:hypothetical protein